MGEPDTLLICGAGYEDGEGEIRPWHGVISVNRNYSGGR